MRWCFKVKRTFLHLHVLGVGARRQLQRFIMFQYSEEFPEVSDSFLVFFKERKRKC